MERSNDLLTRRDDGVALEETGNSAHELDTDSSHFVQDRIRSL